MPDSFNSKNDPLYLSLLSCRTPGTLLEIPHGVGFEGEREGGTGGGGVRGGGHGNMPEKERTYKKKENMCSYFLSVFV